MADFPQSAASRQSIQDAAQGYLNGRILEGKAADRAKEFGVTPRTVERWRASLTGSGSQQRNPLHRLSKIGGFKMTVKADYAAGGDPAYLRRQKQMSSIRFTANEARTLLNQAQADPDEAWQTFFDVYILPSGTIEHAHISFS